MTNEKIAGSWIQAARESSGWLIFFGIIEVIAGICAIFSPFFAGLVVSIFVGILLIITGIANLIEIFKADSFGRGALAFLIGLIALATGVFLVARPGIGLASLTLVLAAYFFVSGISRIILGFDIKPSRGWGWMVFDGAVSILLGILIGWEWPFSGVWAVGILLGIHFIISGWWSILIGFGFRSETSPEQ